MWRKARIRKTWSALFKAGDADKDERARWPTTPRGERICRLIGVTAVKAASRRATGL
ncbi:hypothetical protein [Phenylobacterium sp.]|uniref:hypothetical protein n=1 Tax=Phenylobacterium sp. TaxID=1871053 RepID=UPI00273206B1|nr:hypothetical protein [Phenylobacterium sp.]MDP1617479.1 hypothetical protein [Phenylobacterium sp.]